MRTWLRILKYEWRRYIKLCNKMIENGMFV